MHPTANSATARRSVIRVILTEPLYWLLAAIPVTFVVEHLELGSLWVFIAASVSIIPLAGLMGRATENLAETMGAAVGGLLNATFGNAAELIIALVALSKGPELYPLVKASITGSIIGNILLVLGLALALGGLKYKRQTFNVAAASMGATLLTLAAIGLVIPTLYYYAFSAAAPTDVELARVELLSEEIAALLAGTYLLSLVFSLVTHRNLFSPEDEARPGLEHPHAPEWGRWQSLVVLLVATAGVAVMSEQLVGTAEAAAEQLGMSSVFVGVIVVAIVGNAAEHSTAVLVAMKNKTDLAMNIAVGSSMQIALLVAPVLVFASLLMGHEHPLDLHFTPMEIVAMTVSIAALALVCQDGESHWFEGLMLLVVYVMIALAFYHLPESAAQLHPPGEAAGAK
jgi:Ca2+:H+ antiporter